MATAWDSRFANHPLWPLVDQIRDSVKKLKLPTDVEQRDSFERILWLAELLKAHKDSDDARAYSPSMLDNVQRPLEGNVWNNIQPYLTDPETYQGNFRAAADNVDTVLDAMGNWPTSQKGAAIAAGQTFSSYQDAVKLALGTLNTERDELAQELEDLRGTTESEKERITDTRAAFEAKAEERIEESVSAVEAKYLAETGDSVETIAKSRDLAAKALEALNEMQAQGNRILEAVGNKAVAQDYRTNARNKSFAGWVWDLVGLIIGGVSLILLLKHLFDQGATEVKTSLALTRVAVSIAGVGLAALCFSRGRDNHAESRRSKRADIRLSTVGGFVAQQDPEFKDALTQAMADRIYLQDIVDSPDEYDPTLMKQAVERLRAWRGAPESAAEPE